jgi:hypothetical protein
VSQMETETSYGPELDALRAWISIFLLIAGIAAVPIWVGFIFWSALTIFF